MAAKTKTVNLEAETEAVTLEASPAEVKKILEENKQAIELLRYTFLSVQEKYFKDSRLKLEIQDLPGLFREAAVEVNASASLSLSSFNSSCYHVFKIKLRDIVRIGNSTELEKVIIEHLKTNIKAKIESNKDMLAHIEKEKEKEKNKQLDSIKSYTKLLETLK